MSLKDNSPENLSRKENIEELANGMSDFCAQRLEEGNANTTLSDFLSEVSCLPTRIRTRTETMKR